MVDHLPLTAPEAASATRLHLALRRAQRVLWQTQRSDGRWDATGDMGPAPTAQVVVALHHLGRLAPADATGCAKWLRSQQRADGSFVGYPFAPNGDPGATACAWAALQVAAPNDSVDAITRARAWLDSHGGVGRVLSGLDSGDVSAVYLSLAGLLDPQKLPCPSAAFALLPPVMHFLGRHFHSGIPLMALQLNVIVHSLRGDFGADGKRRGLVERAECHAAVNLLSTFQNTDGSWNANTLQGALALPALRAAGLPITDDRVARGLAWLEGQKITDAQGTHFDAFGSGVWSTAFDVRALLASGIPPGDPRVSHALEWLADSQCSIPQPAVDNRKPGAIRTGGWGFQRGNHTMVDCDDAGVALSALGEAVAHDRAGALSPALDRKVRTAIDRGRDWVLNMQNPDGGWSAFVWDLPPKKPGPAMSHTVHASMKAPWEMAFFLIDPQPALGDPSTEDVTGRVLHGLGQIGFSAHSPEVVRAIEFLRKQQCDHGGWWGRWVVNDLAATAFVLKGLRAVGFDMHTAWVQKAAQWVLAQQNADGGWGETPDSYRNPALAGHGPSMAPLTGLVIQGLLDAGRGDRPEVEKAVTYLLGRQHPDGTWPNDDYLHANVPPDTFYCYPEAARFYPTDALGRYVAFRAHPAPPPDERWSNGQLDAARLRTDPAADAVIASVFARGQVAAVNDMMGKMFRSDAPVPEGLPPEAEAYFKTTGALPTWADPAQIAIAQKLFTRAGWEVATALFCSSLPQAYAAAKGAVVLTQTGAMEKHIRQRIFETAQFIFDVCDEGALAPAGRGIRAAQKVRLMHAGIRNLLLTRPTPAWDTAYLGKPINQEDLAGTLLTFSSVTLDGIAALGITFTSEEAEAWLHLWKAVGTVLGLEAEMLPKDIDDAHALMDAIRERQWAASPDGKALTAALVELMQSFIPEHLLSGAPVALVRHLTGDHCGDLLGLPSSDWTRLLIEVAVIADPLAADGARELGMQKVYDSVRQHIMDAVVSIEREGKQAPFRIPASLRRSLGSPSS